MMDWHYYKDEAYTVEEQKYDENMRGWQKAGFKIFYLSTRDALECPHCGALVKEDRWKKHLTSLHNK